MHVPPGIWHAGRISPAIARQIAFAHPVDNDLNDRINPSRHQGVGILSLRVGKEASFVEAFIKRYFLLPIFDQLATTPVGKEVAAHSISVMTSTADCAAVGITMFGAHDEKISPCYHLYAPEVLFNKKFSPHRGNSPDTLRFPTRFWYPYPSPK